MSRWSEVYQILRGIRCVGRAALNEPIKYFGFDKLASQLDYKWSTGSIKPLIESVAIKVTSFERISSAQSKLECQQRVSMIGEGLKQGGPAIANRIRSGFGGGRQPEDVESKPEANLEETSTPSQSSAAENFVSPPPVSVPLNTVQRNKEKVPGPRVRQQLSETSKERKVPSSRIARVISFGGLFAGLGYGAAAEATKKLVGIR